MNEDKVFVPFAGEFWQFDLLKRPDILNNMKSVDLETINMLTFTVPWCSELKFNGCKSTFSSEYTTDHEFDICDLRPVRPVSQSNLRGGSERY